MAIEGIHPVDPSAETALMFEVSMLNELSNLLRKMLVMKVMRKPRLKRFM